MSSEQVSSPLSKVSYARLVRTLFTTSFRLLPEEEGLAGGDKFLDDLLTSTVASAEEESPVAGPRSFRLLSERSESNLLDSDLRGLLDRREAAVLDGLSTGSPDSSFASNC